MTGIDRREFVSALVGTLGDQALVVTGLGSPTYDVHAAGDRDRTFYLWGAMGGAVPLGLGLALARPDLPVVVVTGDGEMLMGVGSLATVSAQSPANLTVVVLDNGHFGETGMQPSHTSRGTDLVAVALGFGLDAVAVTDVADAPEVAARALAGGGPLLVGVPIATGEPPRSMPGRDGAAAATRFRSALGLAGM